MLYCSNTGTRIRKLYYRKLEAGRQQHRKWDVVLQYSMMSYVDLQEHKKPYVGFQESGVQENRKTDVVFQYSRKSYCRMSRCRKLDSRK